MSRLMKSTDMPSILTTSAAMFIGQYMSQWIAEKFDKDKVWRISITPASKEEGQEIADTLRDNNLAVQTFTCFRNEEKVLGINVFAENKGQSSVVENVLKQYDKVKYNITIIKNRF